MLKYYSMISSLKDEDKVRLLTDITSLSNEERASLGIPEFAFLNMHRILKEGGYPSPQALAHSWDGELIRELSAEATRSATAPISNVVATPAAKVKLSPYRNEMSEDIYLSRSLSSEFARGASNAGASAAVSGYYLTDTDVEWMDVSPSRAVLHEFLVEPFKRAISDGGACAVVSDRRVLVNEYSAENAYLSNAENGNVPSETVVIAKRVSVEETVSFLANGGICLKGSPSALENALKTYYKLQKRRDAGDMTDGEIDAEIKAGRAISPELIDIALDRLLAFLLDASTERKEGLAPEEREAIALKAAKSAIVLLKNDKAALPLNLKRVSSVALIGGIAAEESEGETLLDRCEAKLKDSGIAKIVKKAGYDIRRDIEPDEAIREEAAGAAAECDAVILFLGHGAQRGEDISGSHKLSLPANQLELADRLTSVAKKVIVVLESGFGVDIGFTDPFSAVMLAPFDVKGDAAAIIDVILGRDEPMGRLPYTLYSDIDGYAQKHAAYRNRYGVKSGRFVGYRYYTTAGIAEKYPFGHGLSYAKFAYSKLDVRGNKVSFTVTNTGKRAGREIAQIYVGAKGSKLHRPSRELCGYAIIDLKARESRRVVVDIELPTVWDESAGKMVTEMGAYTVSVGASSTDIRLNTNIRGGSDIASAAQEGELYKYLQTESNIVGDKFTLEAGYKLMNRSIKNIICGIVASVLAIALGVYNALTSSATFLSVLTAILAAAGMIFFIVDAIEKNKDYRKERARIAKENQEHFNDAEQLPEFSAEGMFKDEFEAEPEHQGNAREAAVKERRAYDDSLKYVDKSLDFARAAGNIRSLALERGLMLDEDTVKSILAAVSSSRLLVFKDVSSEDFKSLISLLSDYFGTKTYIDKVDGSYVSEEGALFSTDEEGNRHKRNLTLAIESASNAKERLHIAALDGVLSEGMMKYFTPYVKHARNPRGYTVLTAHNDRNREATYYIPQNMWFAVNLAAGESYDALPGIVSEIATVIRVAITRSAPSGRHTDVGNFFFYQMDYISERAVNRFVVAEELWKRIDSFEKRVKSLEPSFAINNKVCLAFERCAAALMAMGMDAKQSVDFAMAVKLIPAAILASSGKKTENGESLSDIFDAVFGDDDMIKCAEVLKNAENEKKYALSNALSSDEEPRLEAEAEPADKTEAEAEVDKTEVGEGEQSNEDQN